MNLVSNQFGTVAKVEVKLFVSFPTIQMESNDLETVPWINIHFLETLNNLVWKSVACAWPLENDEWPEGSTHGNVNLFGCFLTSGREHFLS